MTFTQLSLLALITSSFILSGCAATPKKTTPPVTRGITNSLNCITNDLSQSEAKDVIVEKWLQTH